MDSLAGRVTAGETRCPANDHVASPARQRPHADGLLACCRRDRKLTLAFQEGEIGPGQLHQGNLVRARSLAWPSLAVEDRQGVITHVSPLQPDELFDALAAGQHMQPQRRCLDARTCGDEFPVRLQVGLGERSLVGAIELRGSTRLRGWVEDDPEGLENDRDRRRGTDIQRALERRTKVRTQLVGRTPLVGLDQPAQHVQHLVWRDVNRGRLRHAGPRFGGMPFEDRLAAERVAPVELHRAVGELARLERAASIEAAVQGHEGAAVQRFDGSGSR